jgi:hypothetical protein
VLVCYHTDQKRAGAIVSLVEQLKINAGDMVVDVKIRMGRMKLKRWGLPLRLISVALIFTVAHAFSTVRLVSMQAE